MSGLSLHPPPPPRRRRRRIDVGLRDNGVVDYILAGRAAGRMREEVKLCVCVEEEILYILVVGETLRQPDRQVDNQSDSAVLSTRRRDLLLRMVVSHFGSDVVLVSLSGRESRCREQVSRCEESERER